MAVNISSAAVRTKAAGRAAAIIIQDKAKDREEVKARVKEEVRTGPGPRTQRTGPKALVPRQTNKYSGGCR